MQGNARDAASRPAFAMPRESTLGGRDGTTVPEKQGSSSRARAVIVHSLVIAPPPPRGLRATNASAIARPDTVLLSAEFCCLWMQQVATIKDPFLNRASDAEFCWKMIAGEDRSHDLP